MMDPIKIRLDRVIHLPSAGLPDAIEAALRQDLIVDNPFYLRGIRYGGDGDVPPFWFALWHDEEGFIIPRGYLRNLANHLHRYRLPFEIKDETRHHPPVNFRFQGSLFPRQEKALTIATDINSGFAIFSGLPGSGRTTAALALIAARQQPALIVARSRRRFHIWKEAITRWLGEEDIGLIGNGKDQLSGRITIAIWESLYRRMMDVVGRFGFLVVDDVWSCSLRQLAMRSVVNSGHQTFYAASRFS